MKSFDFPFNGCNYLSEWSIMFQASGLKDVEQRSPSNYIVACLGRARTIIDPLSLSDRTTLLRTAADAAPKRHIIRMQLKINWNEFNSNWNFLNVARTQKIEHTNFNYFYNETKLNFNLLISLSFCLWAPLNQQLKMLRWKKGEKKAQKHISEQNVCCILNGRIMW